MQEYSNTRYAVFSLWNFLRKTKNDHFTMLLYLLVKIHNDTTLSFSLQI